ncbi:MAG TPA: hypothetical protein VIM58_04735 [Candidatus Methylacidiphilales bacterium]
MSAGAPGPDPALLPILAAFQSGREAEGRAALAALLAARPDHVEARALAAFLAVQAGEKETARKHLAQASLHAPAHSTALNNLGLLAEDAECDADEIVALFRRAALADPGDEVVADNLERVLVAKGLAPELSPDEAEAFWREETAAHPRLAGLWTGLGNRLLDAGDLAGAEEAFVRAARIRPERAETRVNLGIVRHRRSDPEAALRLYAEAEALETASGEGGPSAPLRWNRALSRLILGDFAGGFADYEARDYLGAYRRFDPARVPRWDGAPFPGKTLLLHAEQGFGDAIQFVRYARIAKERGGCVLLACPAPLERLFARVPGVDAVVPTAALDRTAFDLEAPLLSLPRIAGTRLETVPASVPYLYLDGIGGGSAPVRAPGPLRVGLVAAGNPKYGNDLRRSVPPALLAPLAAVPGIEWTGLHHGTPPGLPWLKEGLAGAADFLDTALRMRELDLVISVDTAAAHLAGALGLPVWVLLPAAPDWRWLRDRADSPWYPTARLFRQRADGDWAGVVAAAAAALSTLSEEAR